MSARKKPARTPPAIDLRAFAGEHLFYEVQMFLEARAIVPAGQFARNLKAEVVVIHLRNLVDFFYLFDPKPDDVIASDYVPGWEQHRPAITSQLEAARTRANKEMAHLTTKRIHGVLPEKSWDFAAISADLRVVASAFVWFKPLVGSQTIQALLRI